MRSIDLETWARRDHFRLFSALEYPHFGLCANVNVTAFRPYVKAHGYSFTVAVIYILARAANAIPEFRYRIRGGQVVEHELVHPSTTILVAEDVFSFCTLPYRERFAAFAETAAEKIARVRASPYVEDEPGQDELLYMTPIPWVSFTSFLHPLALNPVDSVPRFAWGKFYEEGQSLKMPLNVQAHHALMDGVHMGRYYAHVQDDLDHPETALAQG